jgi:hypothetical protein
VVKRPRARGLQRLAGLVPGVAPRIDPTEAAAHDAAVREAFLHGTPIEAPRRVASVPHTEERAPSDSTPADSLVPPAPAAATAPTTPHTVRNVEPVSPAPAAATAPTTAEPAAEVEQQAGESAPDFLLRTPTGATRIADDFFDGLIRRVEGDR